VVVEWERDAIRQGTRDALAERKAAGVGLGRERMTPPAIVARIVADAEAGLSASAIARALDAEAVCTPDGVRAGYPSTVSRLLRSERTRKAA